MCIGFKDISTKCRTRYLLAVSPENKKKYVNAGYTNNGVVGINCY